MNDVTTINQDTVVTLPKRSRGRPPKDTSTELALKPLASIKEIKEDAIQHLQAYYKEPWTEKNITYKLKAIQLILQQVDGLKDEAVVAEQESSVPSNHKVSVPDVETVELSSLSKDEMKAYMKFCSKQDE